MTRTFVHLRLHSEYSLSDSMVRIKPLVSAVANMDMPAVAITDETNLFALIKFYNAANHAGIKPIVAADVWVKSMRDREAPTLLVLMARNTKGYRNLTELLSKGYREGQQLGRPILTRDWIAQYAEGLIALSGGCLGDVGMALLAGNRTLAEDRIQAWLRIFPEAFYLELQRTGKEGEGVYIQQAVDLALGLGCPVVATNDVRFICQDEFEAHEVRVCIHDGCTLDNRERDGRYTDQQYLKSTDEMYELFADIPEALENTVEIAKRCNVSIQLGEYFLPTYPIPEGYTTDTYLCQVAKQGLEERLAKVLNQGTADYATKRQTYDERLAFELAVINDMGFPSYFLIVMEFIQWAKENHIPVGPGRGSGAGSLVAYALKITDIDPLRYNLLFERFLNPERVSLPDFDIDFCMDGRDRVIQHVSERYGQHAVSQIITFGTLAAKAVVRDVARVQGKPYGLADKLSKLIPFDPKMTLAKAQAEEPLLREFIANNEDADEIIEMACKLEGLTRNVGKHAGGVVIAPTRISDFTPIYCDQDGSTITQFDKDDVEQVGLVKFDFLGLRTLTIIDNAIKSINVRKQHSGEAPIDIDAINLEDARVYQHLKAARTTAVFQLESRGMKDLIKQVKPNRFGDIVALVALFRPGPLQLAPDFIKRKHGIEAVNYLHSSLQPILEDTYGVMLYQEQVMQIAQVLSSYTLADADLLRRAMGKKKKAEMAAQRDRFRQGAVANGVREQQADHIFDLMARFADYGFNRPHSVAYALLAYQTAWLKHYYPADFMAAVLSADMQTTDKVVANIEECRALKVPISPPDINQGEFRFVADTDCSIVYGLGAIKGLGEGPIRAIVQARQQDPFSDLYDLCERLDPRIVNKRAIEALIHSGALDELAVFAGQSEVQQAIDYRRALLITNQKNAAKVAEQKARNQDSGSMDLFGNESFHMDSQDCRYHHVDGLNPIPLKERLGREKDALGLYLTGHPMDIHQEELQHFKRTRIADLCVTKDEQTIVGLVVDVRTIKSKKNETLAFVTLDDRSGRIEVSIFAELYAAEYNKLAKDMILVCQGNVSQDEYTAGVRMRANQVFDLVQARGKSVKCLKLQLISEDLADNFTTDLAAILAPFKGKPGEGCPVSIAYIRAEVEVEVVLGDSWRVSLADDLLQNLRDHYGTERVLLDY